MIGSTPTPVIMAGDIYSLATLMDPLILSSIQNPSATLKFPAHTTITLRRKKVISSTNVNGRSGTIKEVSGIGDWMISIDTEFNDPSPILPGNYGPALMARIKQALSVFKDQGKLKVLNKQLNAFDIQYLFIEELELPPGDYSTQKVRLRCISDYDYTLDYFQKGPDAYEPPLDPMVTV